MTKEQINDPILQEIVQVVMTFATKLSGKKYYAYQWKIGESILKHAISQTMDDITILLSRQSGKSTISAEVTSAMLVVLPALAKIYGDKYRIWDKEANEGKGEYVYPMKRFATNFQGAGTGGIRIGVYAPKEQQAQVIFTSAKSILEGERGRAILKELGVSVQTSRGDTFILSNNSKLICETASEGANIESATHDLVLLDEAQDIVTYVIGKSIRPMLANTGGNMVYIGTCGTEIEDFYRTIKQNKNMEIIDGIQRHFEYDYNFCSAANPLYKKFVEKEIAKYGFDSDFVKMNYRLMWLLERGQFCTEDMLHGKGDWAQKALLVPNFEIITVEKYARCYAGLDLGKKNDSTVLTIVAVDETSSNKNRITDEDGIYYTKYILNWLELYGDNYESQYWQIYEFLKSYNIDKLCIDATSQGDPIADRFSTYLTSIDVEPVIATQKQNSEMFKLLQQEIQAGRIKIPYGPLSREKQTTKKFIHQLLELEKDYNGQFLKVAHPKIRGAHDDYFSSLALAIWATQDGCMPEIESGANMAFGRKNNYDSSPKVLMSRR